MFYGKINTALLPLIFIAGCGSSDNTSSDTSLNSNDDSKTARFSLAISDAPVDALSQVVVCFNQIELKRDEADVVYTVGSELGVLAANDLCTDDEGELIANTVGIDLLQYAGSQSINLVNELEIEAGTYSQMRLIMAQGSYGIDSQTEEKIAISIPSNELKLDGFNVGQGSEVDFTLEFDLNKAMTNPVGKAGYFLKPRGLRLVDNNEIAHITGGITEALLIESQCSPLADSSISLASVYLYQGHDLNITSLGDNGGSEDKEPLASTAVSFDSAKTAYTFELGFINQGSYTLALTCNKTDDPELDDDIIFISGKNVSIAEGDKSVSIDFDISADTTTD